MNNKLIYIFLVLISWCSNAQNTSLHVDSNDYATIDSYSGIVKANAYDIWLDGNGTLNLPTWRISVRVTSPIVNSNQNGNQVFPANKISLLPVATSGMLNQSTVPTIPQIGMPLQTFLQQGQEVFLVPQSQAGLYNVAGGGNPYYQFHIRFDLKIEGGAYLAAFKTYSEFSVPLEFKYYDEKGQLKGSINKMYRLQIGALSGTPPVTPQFSIKIASNAVNGLLELKTKQDYLQGASVTYPGGIIVSANTDYQVKVTSLQPVFTSVTGSTLPLGTVRLNLMPEAGNQGAVFPITLSNTSQKIASGANTNGQVSYSITYATQPNDMNLITGKMEQYSTTLQYEILPK
ncbi:hypothetical protein NU10_12015 [Flavobacterium dauae]|uniref:hypothetical protein n=1 Tax=Flavobacterium dauae TaxID=1563479 RepID=UPI00101B509B|nr:hypothetical protein [Flavobacterium dauae]WLD23426.1 hypothetical protein NU10_12015 [Flavobacterium dauae]